jgi:hypothetical protein
MRNCNLHLDEGYFPSQLIVIFRKIILTYRLRVTGKRTILAGDVKLLKGKEIGKKAQLGNLLGKMPLLNIRSSIWNYKD